MMKAYDERADFEHHDAEVEQMLGTLAKYKLSPPDQGLYLDVGGGQGMHVWQLAPRCSRLIVADVINFSSLYEGQFCKLLHEKHLRHNRPFDLGKVAFLHSDAQAQLFRDEIFDFIFSFNAFEHIPDPERALAEVARMLKPGGIFHLQFDPIWTSPEGNHFAHYVPEPWEHLLISTEAFVDRMRQRGASQPEISDFVHTLNRRPVSWFIDLFERASRDLRLEILLIERWAKTCKEEPRTEHPNFGRSLAAGHSELDLVTRGLRVAGRKK